MAEACAARVRAVRRVEREHARLELGEADAVLGTGEPLRERHLATVHDVDRDEPIGKRERGLDRVREAMPQVGLHHEAIDDHVNRALELLVELDLLVEETLLRRP